MRATRPVRRLELTVLTLAFFFFSELGIVQSLLPIDCNLHRFVVKQSKLQIYHRPSLSSSRNRRRRPSQLFLSSSSLASSSASSVINAEALLLDTMDSPDQHASVAFSHVHLYADHLEDLAVYKSLEVDLNNFAEALAACTSTMTLDEQRELWLSMTQYPASSETSFVSHGRDVVKQLMAGLGFRVTAARYSTSTRTVLVTSQDADGVQILVTAASELTSTADEVVKQDDDSYFFDSGTSCPASSHDVCPVSVVSTSSP
jgi:hypothetical protein